MLRKFFKRKNRQSFYDRHWPWCLGGILLLALGLRLINISAEPFWADEILSLDIATKSAGIGEMLRYLALVEFHPPLFYLILALWTKFIGVSELALRSLSVLFSLGTIVVVYFATLRMFKTRAGGLLTALLLAVLPVQIEFGQEARPYAIMCFFAALAIWLLWEHLLRRNCPMLAVGYILSSLIGIYLHYSFAFLSVALAIWWLIESLRNPKTTRSREFVYWLVAHAVMFIGFLPWLVPFLYKICLSSFDIYGIPRRSVPDRASYFIEGVLSNLVWLTKEKTVYRIELLSIYIFKFTFLWLVVVFIKAAAPTRRFTDGKTITYLLWLVLFGLAMFAVSPQSMNYSKLFFRHVMYLSIPMVMLIARIAVGLPRKKAALMVVLLVVTLVPSIARVAGNDALWDYDFRLREMAEFIEDQYRAGDLVIVYFVSIRSDLAHYLPPDIPIATMLPTNYYGKDHLSSRHRLGIVENEMQVRIEAEPGWAVQRKLDNLLDDGKYDRVWLFMFSYNDFAVQDWFMRRDWRKVYENLDNIFTLDMYSKR